MVNPRYDFINKELIISGQKIIIPNIKFERVIGYGANAVVLEGIDQITERTVAIKIWLPRREFKYPDPERFFAEVRKIAKINREKVVQLYSANIVGNYFYAILEYINGITLKEWLIGNRSPVKRRLIVENICREMYEIHKQKIYHGDLHSKNIMITVDDKIKILDFGTSIFARSEEEAHAREGEVLLETCLQILNDERCKLFLDLNPSVYPPECINLTMLFLSSKILDVFDQYLNSKEEHFHLVSSLSLFVTLSPFFNLNNIIAYLEEQKIEKRFIEFFIGDTYETCKTHIHDLKITDI